MNYLAAMKPRTLSPITWSLFIFFISLILFFNYVDVYNNNFFTTGRLIIAYNTYRVFFIVALTWLFYIVGQFTLRLMPQSNNNQMSTLDNTIASFIIGVGVTHILLFITGLSQHYTRPLITTVTLIIFAMSLPRLDAVIRAALKNIQYANYTGLLILAIPLSLFLLTKGLYPAGGHDYYNHYFHFYRKVTESGSLLPNEVWYHFYYSKGAALFFLSMLLTDPLAPQLASTAMILAGAAIVFSILNRSATFKLLPWAGAALYILLLIYTPGPYENMRQGGWGDLEKPHEPAAVLVLAMLWITIQLASSNNWKFWGATLALAISALVLINPVMSVFVAIFLTITAICFLLKKNYFAALAAMLGGITAGLWLATIWTINYLFTGIPDDQSLFVFWPIVNFDTIKNWGTLFEIFVAHWAKTGQVANSVPLTLDIIPRVLAYLRLDVWWLLFVLTICVLTINLAIRKWREPTLKTLDKSSLAIIGGFLFVIAVLSMVIGRDQPISFYRFTTFTYAPMLCLCLILQSATVRNWFAAIAVATIAVFSTHYFMTRQLHFLETHEGLQNFVTTATGQYDKGKIKNILINARHFAMGRFSLADAYQNQQGWPGRMPWGGIYPPAISAWEQVPRNTPIWSMHIHSYCMLPGCHMEGHMSFRLSPHASVVYYGLPQEAKKWFQQENHNYFFISNSLQLTDPLPLTPLFSPDNITKYLGVVWSDGDNALLTWKESSVKPIDTAWLKKYREQVKASPLVQSFPYKELKLVLANAENTHRIKNQDIPWYHAGWK